MAEQTYPPIGDPGRFDAIVERGSLLRRRRRGAAVGALGSFVVVIGLAAALLVGRPGTAESSVIAAGPADDAPATTTTAVGSTELTAVVDVDGDRISVTVDDPAQPVSEQSQQCVHAVLLPVDGPSDAPAIAEGSVCDQYPGVSEPTDSNQLILTPTTVVAIGCAAVQHNEWPVPEGSAPRSSDIEVTIGDVPSGTYRLVATVSSGIGDGCSVEPQPYERRAVATSNIVVD